TENLNDDMIGGAFHGYVQRAAAETEFAWLARGQRRGSACELADQNAIAHREREVRLRFLAPIDACPMRKIPRRPIGDMREAIDFPAQRHHQRIALEANAERKAGRGSQFARAIDARAGKRQPKVLAAISDAIRVIGAAREAQIFSVAHVAIKAERSLGKL